MPETEGLTEIFKDLFSPDKILIVVRSGIILIFGLPLIFFIAKWLRKHLPSKMTAQQKMLISKSVLYLGVTLLIISILNDLDFKISHLLGAAGIIGIAVGFASQTSVSNIISGLFLVFEKPFEVGDVITVNGTTGIILSIDLLSIKLRTFDNKLVRVPNETIIKSEVINVTRFPIRRVDINVGVAYKEDLSRVKKILLDIADKNTLCLTEPEPMVIYSGYGNSSVDLLFLAWTVKEDWFKLKNTLMEEIKARFDAEGIEIPFPHVSLYAGEKSKPISVIVEKELNDRDKSSEPENQNKEEKESQ